MDFSTEIPVVGKLFVSLILGGVVGLDREIHGKDAGIRTYAAVCIGSTIFTAIAEHIVDDPASVSRIVANVITGIGFLGAGIIYRDSKTTSSHGLTTAATIWCTAAVGIAVGLDMFLIAFAGTGFLYFLLSLHHQRWYISLKNKKPPDE